MLLGQIDEMTDTFSQFYFKFHRQFKGENVCYPLIQLYIFFCECSFFFMMIEVFTSHLRL